MKALNHSLAAFVVALAAALFVTPAPAQESSPASPAAGQPNETEMMKQMMELSKLNDNHKLLTSLDGRWNYTVKMWMNGDPSSKPDVSHGTATASQSWPAATS